MDEHTLRETSGPALINLKILSPSTEVNGDIFFPGIPAATTVKELKLRIQNELSTRPSVERMRLIYRGRVMAKETDTMFDVFGRDNIHESADHSLHLVLRELPQSSQHPNSTSSTPVPRHSATPVPRSSTAPPQNPFRLGPPSPNTGTNPFRAGLQQRPNSQPQAPHLHQPPNPFANLPLPPEMNNIVQQQIAQAMAHAQAAHGQAHHHMPPPPPPQASANGTPIQSTEQSASRASARETVDHQQAANGGGASPMNNGGQTSEGTSAPNLTPNLSTTTRREHIGPNGERWTVTINNSNFTIPAQQPGTLQHPNLSHLHHNHQHPNLNSMPNVFGSNGPPSRGFPTPPVFGNPLHRIPFQGSSAIDQALGRIRTGLHGAQREMENVRLLVQGPTGELGPNGLVTGTSTPTWRHDQIRRHIESLMQHLDQLQASLDSLVANPELARNRDVLSLQMLNNNLRSQAGSLSESIDRLHPGNAANREAAGSIASSNAPTPASTTPLSSGAVAAEAPQRSSSSERPSAPTPEFFLLSSPQGPVGVLFDQRGTYTTAPFQPSLSFENFNNQFNANRQVLAALGQQIVQRHQQPVVQPANIPLVPQAQNANLPAGAAPQAAQQAAGGAQLQGQDDRLNQIMGHFWLLFKLLCFVYIFAGGGGWRRPVMLGIAAALVYLAQLGLFEHHFERVRRHFEALLPLADRDLRNLQNQDRNPQAGGPQPRPAGVASDEAAVQSPDPTPEQVAERLMRERNERGLGWVRQRMRTVERAVALFVASLWPGLGERMVHAREQRIRAERAEESRRAEQEEAASRAQQERERGDGERPDEDLTEADSSGEGKGKEKANEVDQEFQEPVAQAGSSNAAP